MMDSDVRIYETFRRNNYNSIVINDKITNVTSNVCYIINYSFHNKIFDFQLSYVIKIKHIVIILALLF